MSVKVRLVRRQWDKANPLEQEPLSHNSANTPLHQKSNLRNGRCKGFFSPVTEIHDDSVEKWKVCRCAHTLGGLGCKRLLAVNFIRISQLFALSHIHPHPDLNHYECRTAGTEPRGILLLNEIGNQIHPGILKSHRMLLGPWPYSIPALGCKLC